MAFYVLIRKEVETDTEVIYRFGPEEGLMGRLRLRKADGETEELTPVPAPQASALFTRAMWKVLQHWEKGEYPETTCWAS